MKDTIMVNQQPYRAVWSLALALALAGILVAACGNRPTPEQITAIPTDTPAPPTPTSTFTPEPTATPIPTSTPTPIPTLPPTETPTPVGPPIVIASEGPTNIRLGPGTNFLADGLMDTGQSLEIVGRNAEGTWWQVSTASGLRWLAAEVTTTQNVTDEIPVVDFQAEIIEPPTPTPAPTEPPEPAEPEPTPTPEIVTCSNITVITPAEGATFTVQSIEVRWSCDGELPEGHSFEVRFWPSGEDPVGAHNSVNDAPRFAQPADEYNLMIPVREVSGFIGVNEDYNIAVSLVQISPEYEDTGVMSEPVLIRYE
jgi:hypothetical protein